MKRVACLSRVSTLDQHSSIDNQQEIFENWLKRNKGCIIYRTYTDEGISGAKGYKRKQWLQMLEDGRKKQFDILLAKSYSRFGRNQRETLEAIAMLRSNGIRVVLLEDSLDSEKDASKFGLFAWLAEQEAQKTSERIKMVWENYNQEGKVHVTLAPYGYDYSKEIKNFIINPIESKIVRKIFMLYIQGNGFNKIAQLLREEGISTKRGGKWAGATVSAILQNDFYLGILTQGRTQTIDVTMDTQKKIPKEEWIKHYENHEAIISKEQFEKVQEEINKRSNKAKRFYTKEHANLATGGTRQSNASLFSNLLVCGECGAGLTIKRKKRLKNYKPHYNCISYDLKGTVECGHTSNFIWEDILTEYIKDKLDKLVANNYEELKQRLKEKNSVNDNKALEKELKVIKSKLEQQVTISTALLTNFTNGIIGEMQFKLQNESIEKSLNQLVKRKDELEEVLNSKDTSKEEEKILIGGVNELLETDMEHWNNAMMKAIIEKITVFIDGTINVHFKYLNYK
ncbi:Recombinase [Clostridium sp. DL-VIII]|uniref:recombinase family protein n=1 Tax=Clostridium sp. DL-VIII TaxID=641107 RepID=UPI00023B0422|nr:recombinase family protein [Clostridium sp. DL-VIII]EHJ01893.1 Recombinase [Clostridium sp. DL-VIII]